MAFDNLKKLFKENETLLKEIEQTHPGTVAGATDGLLTLANDEERVRNQQFLDGVIEAKDGTWEDMEKALQLLRTNVQTLAKAYDTTVRTLDKKNLAKTAFSYHQGLLTLNTAITYAIEHLEAKNDRAQAHQIFIFGILNMIKRGAAQMLLALNKLSDKTVKTLIKQNDDSPKRERSSLTPNLISLTREIDLLSDRYTMDYKQKYGVGFWFKIKEFFKNSDRTTEIEFLKQISNSEQCTDGLRLDAMTLVKNKIATQEFFGGGSLLRDRLVKLIDLTSQTISNDPNDNLKLFCETHKISMPTTLHDYLEKNAAHYTSNVQ